MVRIDLLHEDLPQTLAPILLNPLGPISHILLRTLCQDCIVV